MTVASIAKVREDATLMENTDTSELLTEEEEAKNVALAAENAGKAVMNPETTETDDELMKELLERAQGDGEEE